MAFEYQDTVANGGANPLTDPRGLHVVEVGGNVYALVGGEDDTLAVYSIDNTPGSPTYGELSNAPIDSVVDDATLQLKAILSIESIEVDGTTYVIAGGGDNGVSVFSLASDGTLSSTDTVVDDAIMHLKNADAIATASVDDGAGGTNEFVFVSGNDSGISAFSIDGSGTLTSVQNVADDGTLNIGNVQGMDTIAIDDGAGGINTYLIAGSLSGGASVFEVASDGTLTNTQNLADDLTVFLATPRAVETAVIDGTGYVFVGGWDDGVSVFEIDNTGTMTNVGNLADDASLHLRDIADLHFTIDSGVPTLIVGSEGDDGIDSYTISIDGGTGAVTLTRATEIPSGSNLYTGQVAGTGNFIVTSDHVLDQMDSYTVACFAAGTRILTDGGGVDVEDLGVGDRVQTLDAGYQPVRWIGVTEHEWAAEPHKDKPIRFAPGTLGAGLPHDVLLLSPNHRVLFPGGPDKAARLGPAKAMTGLRGVRQLKGCRRMRYVHLMLDAHHVLFAGGAPCESLYPGPQVLLDFTLQQRTEILAITESWDRDEDTGEFKRCRDFASVKETRTAFEARRICWTELEFARLISSAVVRRNVRWPLTHRAAISAFRAVKHAAHG